MRLASQNVQGPKSSKTSSPKFSSMSKEPSRFGTCAKCLRKPSISEALWTRSCISKLHMLLKKTLQTVKDGRKKNAQAILSNRGVTTISSSFTQMPAYPRCKRQDNTASLRTAISAQKWIRKNVFLMIRAKKMSNIKYASKMFPTCFKQVSSVVPLCFHNASKGPSDKHLRFQKSCHGFSAHWYHVIIKNMPPTNQAVSINFKTARFRNPKCSISHQSYWTLSSKPFINGFNSQGLFTVQAQSRRVYSVDSVDQGVNLPPSTGCLQ